VLALSEDHQPSQPRWVKAASRDAAARYVQLVDYLLLAVDLDGKAAAPRGVVKQISSSFVRLFRTTLLQLSEHFTRAI
jgi:hypothetical protein